MGKHVYIFLLALSCVAIESAVMNVEKVQTKNSLEECLNTDSISCVQLHIFRTMKSFFGQENVNLLGGFSFVKNVNDVKGRSVDDLNVEKDIEKSNNVEERETALESYAMKGISEFFEGRSLQWDPTSMVEQISSSARTIASYLPEDFSKSVSELMTEEGRGKKKKLMRFILPFLIGIKLKLGAALALAALGVALIAKKAILASVLSIIISVFIGLKKLLSHKQHHEHHGHAHSVHDIGHHGGYSSHAAIGSGYSNVGSYSSPVAAYSDSNSGGWDASTSYSAHGGDTYGSHSSPVAHAIAFGGQKPKRK